MKVIKIIIEMDIELVNDLVDAFHRDVIDTINMDNPYHAEAFNLLQAVLEPHKTGKGRKE